MANKDREITIKVTLDGNNAVKGSAKVKKSVRGIKDETGKASKGMKGFGLQTVATGAIAAVALNKIAEYGKQVVTESYRLATAAQETASKYKTVLGPSISEANKFLDANAEKMGLNETAAKDLLATNAAIAQGFGFTGRSAADMAIKVVKLAGDLTSFNNVPIERTQNAVTSALSGETEALKSLGIVLRQADVQERALANTGKTSADALTQQERATASLQLITEKAGVAVGDLNRTQNSTANQARRAAAEYENFKIELSKGLLPVYSDVIGAGASIISSLNEWIKTPIVDEIRQEKDQFNELYVKATNVNTSQDRRIELIKQMKQQYPDFLEGINAETVSNEKLHSVYENVNKDYAKQISTQLTLQPVLDAYKDQQEQNYELGKLRGSQMVQNSKFFAKHKAEVDRLTEGIDLQNLSVFEANKLTYQLSEAIRRGISLEKVQQQQKEYDIKTRDILTPKINEEKNARQELSAAVQNARVVLQGLGKSQKEINDLLGPYILKQQKASNYLDDFKQKLSEASKNQLKQLQKSLQDQLKSLSKTDDQYQETADKIDLVKSKTNEWSNLLNSASKEQLTTWKTALLTQISAVSKSSDEYASWSERLKNVNETLNNLHGAGGGGVKGLTTQIKAQKEALDALNNKNGEWTDAEKVQANVIATKIHQLEQLLAKRKELEKIPPAPVVESKQPDSEPLKPAESIDTSGGFDAGDPIIDTLTKRMLKEQEYFALQKELANQRQLLDQAETASARSKANANIDSIRRQMAAQNLLRDTVLQASRAQINSLEEYGRYVEETVKKAIKARIAEAVATQVEKALGSTPFPFNIAIAAAAGGAVSLLFNKLVPDFGRGGVLQGPSHARGGIPVMRGGRPIAEAEGDEAFINKKSTKLFYDELSAINQAGGGARFPGAKTVVKAPPHFAAGGIIDNGLARRYARQAIAHESLADQLRQALESATLVAPVKIQRFDDELKDNREIEQSIGNDV